MHRQLLANGGAIHVDGEGTLIRHGGRCCSAATTQPGNMTKVEIRRIFSRLLGIGLSGCRGTGPRHRRHDGRSCGQVCAFSRPGHLLVDATLDGHSTWPRGAGEPPSPGLATDAKVAFAEVPRAVRGERGPVDAGAEVFCASYTNFYIANGAIIMPAYGGAGADEAAGEVLSAPSRTGSWCRCASTQLAHGEAAFTASPSSQPGRCRVSVGQPRRASARPHGRIREGDSLFAGRHSHAVCLSRGTRVRGVSDKRNRRRHHTIRLQLGLERNLNTAEPGTGRRRQRRPTWCCCRALHPYFCIEQYHVSGAGGSFEQSRVLRRFSALARELGVVLPISWFERADNAYFNSWRWRMPDGRLLGVYRKTHIPNISAIRRRIISARGYGVSGVWDTAAGHIEVGICWISGSRAARAMALQGSRAAALSHRHRLGAEGRGGLDSRDHWQLTQRSHAARQHHAQ